MHDQRPVSESKRGWRASWPAAVAYLILGAMLLFAVRPGDLGDSYLIGRSLGVLLISILVSYGMWALMRRARGSGERWSPWVLLIALFVATVVKGVPASESALPQTHASASPSHIESLTTDDVFTDLPGLRYEPVPAEALEEARQSYFSDPSAAESLLDIDGRMVFERQRQVGVVIALLSTPEAAASEDFRAGVFEGFEASIREQGGGPLTEHDLDGTTARGARTRDGYALSFIHGNATITVLGGDRATAELIASGLLRELDDTS